MAIRLSVVDTENAASTFEGKSDRILRSWDYAALLVLYCDGDMREVIGSGANALPVGGEGELSRGPGCVDLNGFDRHAILNTFRDKTSRSVRHIPSEVQVCGGAKSLGSG